MRLIIKPGCSKNKKIFKAKKIGHLGTLDPATGLLVLALNRATKFSNYFRI